MEEKTVTELQGVQRVGLEILKAFVEVCEKLNLRYYLAYGTLLGAVRHKGFIPWDDDVDVMMPREDYEIFLEKAQVLLPERYFVQTTKTDKEWLACFAKIRDSQTTFIESSVRHLNINHGAYIDIFPLDYCPNTAIGQKIVYLKNRFYNALVAKNCLVERMGLKKFLWNVFCLFTCFYSPQWAAKNREKWLLKQKPTSTYISAGGAWRMREITPFEWYQDGCEVEFEGLKVKAPKEYDKWLTHVYGDYMQLPPEEKRVGHHYAEVIDVEKSYLEYLKKEEK